MKGITEPTCEQCDTLQDEIDDARAEADKAYQQLAEEHQKELDEVVEKLQENQDKVEQLEAEVKQLSKFNDMLLWAVETAAETVMRRAGMQRKEIDDVINKHKSRKRNEEHFTHDMCELFDASLTVADQYESIVEELEDL